MAAKKKAAKKRSTPKRKTRAVRAKSKAKTVKLSAAASTIMLAGEQAQAAALKVGMNCSLRYASDEVAQVVTCR